MRNASYIMYSNFNLIIRVGSVLIGEPYQPLTGTKTQIAGSRKY